MSVNHQVQHRSVTASSKNTQCKSSYTPDISLSSLLPVHLLSEAKIYKGDISESASLEETSQPLLWGLVFETDECCFLMQIQIPLRGM